MRENGGPTASGDLERPLVLFSDFFGVDPAALDAYGAFDVSLVADLPLFIDPFLLFNSDRPEYQELHEAIIRYLTFLRDRSLEREPGPGELAAWYAFKEVHQTWLGFARNGNRGSGLGRDFAAALSANFRTLFSDYGDEKVTRGSHLEKLCLIAGGVGRDRISDFTTNLIKGYLLAYTEGFARQHLAADQRRRFRVAKARFNYETETWSEGRFELPATGRGPEDYVLLTPKDMLTQDDTWINAKDLIRDFDEIPRSIGDDGLRAQVNAYFRQQLSRKPKAEERRRAAQRTVARFPQLVDYYIRLKEDSGDRARAVSDERVAEARQVFNENFTEFLALLRQESPFFDLGGTTYDEALERVRYLKQVVERNDGYRLFYDAAGRPIKREADLQVLYRFCWYGSPLDVNREVNNGRGPVDYKVSAGARDATLVEFKLASNTQLRRNLEKQAAVYEQANPGSRSVKAILYFDADEERRVKAVLRELGLASEESVVLIDARRDNKPSGSKA